MFHRNALFCLAFVYRPLLFTQFLALRFLNRNKHLVTNIIFYEANIAQIQSHGELLKPLLIRR